MDKLNLTKDTINQLAELCGETSGASFTITRLKDKTWQVAFVNSGLLRNIKGKDIDAVLIEACREIKDKRIPIETELRYTVYGN
jgi:hypothetical protein